MSERKYISIVTDFGTKKIVDATKNGKKIDIVSFAVGDGDGMSYRPTKDMTALKNEVWRGSVTSYEIMEESPNVIRVTALLPSDVGGFTVREMGLFDKENNMIAIANTADLVKVRSTDGMQSEVSLAMRIAVSNTDEVIFEIDSNLVYVSQKDLEKHNQSLNVHQNLKNIIFQRIAEMILQRDIIIPATGWIELENGFSVDLLQEDITEEMIPNVSIFPEDMAAATNCSLSTVCMTGKGFLRFYAQKIPEKEINASLVLLRANSQNNINKEVVI